MKVLMETKWFTTINQNACSSRTVYTVLFAIAFLIMIGGSSAFIYFHGYLKSDTNIANINPSTEAVIY